MKKSHQFKRKGKSGTAPAASPPPWKERLVVAACIVSLLAVLALLGTMAGVGQQRKALDKQLAQWKPLYHLTDEQAERIRQIELDFHGNGNPFTSRVSGTPEEDEAHHLEISRVMKPKDAERFLRDKGRH